MQMHWIRQDYRSSTVRSRRDKKNGDRKRDRESEIYRNAMMKEYWKEQKRLWTDPNEWKKLYSWTHWKIELKKEFIKQKEEAREGLLKLIIIGVPLGIWVVYILYETYIG